MKRTLSLLALGTLLVLTSCRLTMPNGKTCTVKALDADHQEQLLNPGGAGDLDYQPMPGGYGRWYDTDNARTWGFSLYEDAIIYDRLWCARALPSYLPN